MKKLLSIVVVLVAALFFTACGKDPIVELERQLEKEKNPNRRELFSELAQTFRRERAGQPFDATRGLALSVAIDYPDFAEFFIEKGGNVNGDCLSGDNMLGYASEQHFPEMCRLLVKHGADVNSRSEKGETPMMLAIQNTDYTSTSSARRLSYETEGDSEKTRREVIEFLFEKGADVNAESKRGKTALLYAVVKQDTETLSWLIQKGADVRACYGLGNNIFQVAVSGRDKSLTGVFKILDKSLEVLRILLDAGVDPNAGAEEGFENSALKLALDESRGEDFSYAECLLKYGADVNAPSMLNFYIAKQNVPVVKFLLAHGANPNSEAEAKCDENGIRRTSLYQAAYSGNLDMVKLLMEAGADVNKRSAVEEEYAGDSQSVPVMYACLKKPEIVKYLLEHGADPNAIIIRDVTLLAEAVYRNYSDRGGCVESAELLLSAGADPNVFVALMGPNAKGRLIDFAIRTGCTEMVRLLASHGAKSDLAEIETVKIPNKPYAFGKYEITQKQYRTVMGENPSRFKGENLPVENVSWHDADNFCRRLTELERALGRISANQKYRLPTLEEWEYACRAGTTTRFYTGDSEADLSRAGWYDGNSWEKTHPVGQKEPNAFGLYDMHGNVWEWTSTATSRVERVRLGGGWCASDRYCESSSAYSYSPDARSAWIGFRVVLDPATSQEK